MIIYTLYKKTHNKTGLQYLGYTKQEDPHKYLGSGIVWNWHIEKHGYDVTTEILFQTEDRTQIKTMGQYYSRLWNIIEEVDKHGKRTWANLKEEDGQGGSMPGKLNGMYGKTFWNNGIIQVGSDVCPGDDWVQGRINGPTKGKSWWNNGIESTMAELAPGPDWSLGRLSGSVWWTNGTEEKKLQESPGPEWYAGRLKTNSIKGYKVYNNGTEETRAKNCPGPLWKAGALTGKTTGRKHYNNGVINKMFKEYPGNGWVLGYSKSLSR